MLSELLCFFIAGARKSKAAKLEARCDPEEKKREKGAAAEAG